MTIRSAFLGLEATLSSSTPFVSNMRLSKVLMDGGSPLNILYIDTL